MLLPMEFGVKICKFLSGKMELQFRTNLGAYFTALALEYKQGGYTWVGSRTNVDIAFPISFSHVLGIAGLAVVNNQNPSGRGLEHIKTFAARSFIYYSGYDIADKWLTWLAVGI